MSDYFVGLVAFNCLLLNVPPVSAAPREWKSNTGAFTVRADLLGFDGREVKLKKMDGAEIAVPLEKLSEVDRKYLGKTPLTATVVKFQGAMEGIREVEAERLKVRLEELLEQLSSGSKEDKHPVAQEAKVLQRNLAYRLKVIKSGEPFLPRLSPKDFAVGQIGEFDNDLAFNTSRIEMDGSA
jgi:hypothetical protein